MAAPAKLITTSVGFQDPLGNPVSGGLLVLKLSQNAEVIATGGQVYADQYGAVLTLDVNGKISSTAIWFSDELQPAGTTYRAILIGANKTTVLQDFGNWSITGASADLSLMVPTTTGASYPGAVLLAPSGNQIVVQPAGTNFSVNRFEKVRYADQFAGADIFAKANAAIADAGANGVVVIPPGSYGSITTTLTALSSCKVIAEGCTFTYTGAGTAIKIQNVQEFELALGGSTLIGPGTGGSTIGILLGIPSGGTDVLTQSNKISGNGFLVKSFNKGFAFDGSANNGTYSNIINGVTARANNIGFFLVPTNVNFTNANTFSDCFADASVSDGWKIDGATGNWLIGCRSENGGAWGFNLPGTQATQNNMWLGGWSESNVSGDFNAGTAANVFYNSIYGTTLASTTRFGGTWDGAGAGNTIIPAQLAYGSGIFLTITPMVGTGNGPFVVTNQEGGTNYVFAVSRGGVNAGQIFIGTPEYPIYARGKVTGYNNVNTAGQGVPPIYGATSQKTESAADTNVLTFTPPAAAGTYRVRFALTLSAANAATLGWTMTWKDSNGNAKAPTNMSLNLIGVAAPALTFTTSTTDEYYADATVEVDASATPIVVKLTFTGTSFTGKASATVERLQ